MTSSATKQLAANYRGNDTILVGIVFTLPTFWLFAMTAGTIAPTSGPTSPAEQST